MKQFLFLSLFLCNLFFACAEDDLNIEIRSEIETLADDLNDLLTTIESLDEGDAADEKYFHDIVEKIQELAEATEEENLIKLAETVKNKRMKEEELQSSLVNLEALSEELEKISDSSANNGEKDSQIAEMIEMVTKANIDDDEANQIYEVDADIDHEEDMIKELQGIKTDVQHLIKTVK